MELLFRTYMKEYYEELINIGTSIIDLIQGDESPVQDQEITVKSVFLSLESISTICEYISADSYEFMPEVKSSISKYCP